MTTAIAPPRAPHMTPAHRAALEALLLADPDAPHRVVSERFLAASGRTVGVTSIKQARDRLGLAPRVRRREVPGPPPVPGDDNLTSGERRLLLAIMAEFPRASALEVVALFASEARHREEGGPRA